MKSFECDYQEGCIPEILEAMSETDLEQTPGYGEDYHTLNAQSIIRRLCGTTEADVHLLVGGTQANLTVIGSVLKPYQGVIAAQSGHINVHETGAIEQTGHKVLALPSPDGKITAEQIDKYVSGHFNESGREHAVQPGMVYISQSAETGAVYTLGELEEISAVCRRHMITLYLDGARLGYALAADGCDMRISDIAALCDVFYIGGTKIGALFGEAVVICDPAIKRDFRYSMKQRGAMLAKGRLLGIQFEKLLGEDKNGLVPYFEISRRADKNAMRIKTALENNGIKLSYDTTTNQLFPIFDNKQLKKLERYFVFGCKKPVGGGKTEVRICTSWATEEADADSLIEALNAL